MIQITISVVFLAAFIFTLANIITIDSSQIKNLTKTFWVIIVILIPVAGMILWWLVGREYNRGPEAIPFGDPRRYDAQLQDNQVQRPDTDEDIDAAVEREIAFHENEARIRRLEAEVRARKNAADS